MTNYTPEELRRIDALVAEKVFKFDIAYYEKYQGSDYSGPLIDLPYPQGYSICPHYTISIADAWTIVEKLVDHDPVICQWYYEDDTWEWSCSFEDDSAKASTVPLAICLAALKAVDIDIDKALVD